MSPMFPHILTAKLAGLTPVWMSCLRVQAQVPRSCLQSSPAGMLARRCWCTAGEVSKGCSTSRHTSCLSAWLCPTGLLPYHHSRHMYTRRRVVQLILGSAAVQGLVAAP
jgi:hypothetical protein